MKLPEIQISAGAYISAALLVLLLPMDWLLSWVISVAVHEYGHLLALKCCHIAVHEIELGFMGAKIRTGLLTPKQELLCAAAGPFSSLMLLFAAEYFPLVALIGLVQGCFNLLPVYPLDGGRMIRSLLWIIREVRLREKFLAKIGSCEYNGSHNR